MACGHLVPHAVSPLRWYHPPWPRLVCLTMFVQHSDKRRRVRLKWLLKLSAPKSSEFPLIACTYSERRICFLREVGFPFVMTGKLPKSPGPWGYFFYPPESYILFIVTIIFSPTNYEFLTSGGKGSWRNWTGYPGKTGFRGIGSQSWKPRPRHTMSWGPLSIQAWGFFILVHCFFPQSVPSCPYLTTIGPFLGAQLPIFQR